MKSDFGYFNCKGLEIAIEKSKNGKTSIHDQQIYIKILDYAKYDF